MSFLSDASLVMIPSGYKDGTLYSAKPTNGDGDFTFSRGSNLAATRVNSEGLIEKGRENLLLQSNTFDTTWASTNLNITSGQADRNGGNDAWLLSISGGTSDQRIFQNIQYNGVSTLSVYAKKNDSNWLSLRIGSSVNKWYDLENGVLGGSTIVTAYIDASIKDVGNGWYRCSLTFTDNFTTSTRIYPAENDLDITHTSGSIYIQDAQTEVGLVATDYIETGASTAQAGILEDMPRLDYSGGSCPSLLLEPQRTNLLDNSEYLSGGSLSFATYNGITSDTLSPEGVYNANKFVVTASGADAHNRRTYSIAIQDFSLSVYLKGAAGQKFELFLGRDSFAEIKSKLHTCSGDWERVVLSESFSTTSSSVVVGLEFGHTSNDSVSGQEYYFYGAMLEAGSYPTSYIPTYGGSSVTRGVDNPVISSAGGIIDISQGALFIDATIDSNVDTAIYLMKFDGVNFNDTLYLYRSTTGIIQGIYRIGGNAYKEETTSAISGRFKALFTYDSNNDCSLYVNGSKVGSSFSIPTPSVNLTAVRLGGFNDTLAKQSGLTHQSIYFPTALSDDECIQLTTL